MQEFRDTHNGIRYEYVYLESEKAILIWKGKKLEYMIRVIKRPDFLEMMCNCWGDKRHGHCHHKTKSLKKFNFNKTVVLRNWIKKAREEYFINFLEAGREKGDEISNQK